MGRSFRWWGLLTVGSVYFLILVGGIVRASGSGMGCPDWPKCFGRWVPPTAESQLPPHYQELYAEHGYGDQRFNALKTWTEYLNRLVGVSIGFLIFLTVLASLRYWRRDRPVTWWSATAFLLVGFQGWLGSVVVSTNLAPWMVTVHMVVALLIVGILVYALARSQRMQVPAGALERRRSLSWGLPVVLGLSVLQVAMGTQVREQIDELAAAGAARGDWIGELGRLLLVHRSFSLVLLGLDLWLLWQVRRAHRDRTVLRPVPALASSMLAAVAAEIAAGAVLYYGGVPALVQPVHLLLASILVGLQFALWVLYRYGSRPADEADGQPAPVGVVSPGRLGAAVSVR